jgi:hypothetical protein
LESRWDVLGVKLSKADRNDWHVRNLKVPQNRGEIGLPATSNRHALALTDGSTPLNFDLAENWNLVSRGQGGTDSFDEFARERSNVNEFLEAGFRTWLLPSFYLAAARRQRPTLSSLPDLWREV